MPVFLSLVNLNERSCHVNDRDTFTLTPMSKSGIVLIIGTVCPKRKKSAGMVEKYRRWEKKRTMNIQKNSSVRNAVFIGTLCSVSYLGVYFARNILSVVTPQMIENSGYTEEYIGSISSMFFTFYAVGQLINGLVGDKIKSRYMISFGLLLAGICNALFPHTLDIPAAAHLTYGMIGFFLSMIYAPMTKVVAENTEPVYAARCCLGYTFASYLGSPAAGLAAAFLAWQAVFFSSG